MEIKYITEILQNNYGDNKDTLKNLSRDKDNGEYVCDSSKLAFDYDTMIKRMFKGTGCSTPHTPDAIYLDNKVNFIEFKNGKLLNNKVKELQLKVKALEGLYNFERYIYSEKDDDISSAIRYIVVYNETKNPAEEQISGMIKHLEKKAKEKVIRFGLERFKGTYFSEVFTFTKDEFEVEFLKEIG